MAIFPETSALALSYCRNGKPHVPLAHSSGHRLSHFLSRFLSQSWLSWDPCFCPIVHVEPISEELCLHCLTFFSLRPDSQMSFCWEHRIWGWRSAPLTHDLFTLISVFIKGESIHRKTVISCIIQRTYTHFTELTETHCSETSSVMHYCAP